MSKHRHRHRFTRRERVIVCLLDLCICRYCGRPIWPWQQVHMAHEIAFSRGGSDRLSNIGAAHAACNIAAGNANMPPSKRIAAVWLLIGPALAVIALAIAIFFLS